MVDKAVSHRKAKFNISVKGMPDLHTIKVLAIY